jgi:hypothetical protein
MRAIASLAAALLLTPLSALAEEPDWSIEGHWWDTCSCAVPCPCWKDEKPSLKDCPDMAFLQVDKGHYGNAKLDGARLVQVSRSAEGKKMSESVAAKDVQVVNFYVPDDTSPAATAALVALASRFLGASEAAGKKHAVKHVKMQVKEGKDQLDLQIPGVLSTTLATQKDASGNPKPYPIDISVAGWSGAAVLATQERYEFSDDGLSWKFAGKNAMRAPIAWSSAKGPLPGEQGYKEPAK